MDITQARNFRLWWQLSQSLPAFTSWAFGASCLYEVVFPRSSSSSAILPFLLLGFAQSLLCLVMTVKIVQGLRKADQLVGDLAERSPFADRKTAVRSATWSRVSFVVIFSQLGAVYAWADAVAVAPCVLAFVAAASNALAIYFGLAKHYGPDRADERSRDEVEEAQLLVDTQV